MTVWDKRYASDDYIYGENPNVYFKSVIDQLKPGRILVPGAGEGRDAVYAAKLGWDVLAFDLSKVGMEKALRLAASAQTSIRYKIMDAANFNFAATPFDLVAMTFFHLPTEIRKMFFSKIHKTLTHNGHIMIEAFHPHQVDYASGGPRDISMLLTKNILNEELKYISPIETCETKYILNEGAHHQGEAAVTRYLGVRRP